MDTNGLRVIEKIDCKLHVKKMEAAAEWITSGFICTVLFCLGNIWYYGVDKIFTDLQVFFWKNEMETNEQYRPSLGLCPILGFCECVWVCFMSALYLFFMISGINSLINSPPFRRREIPKDFWEISRAGLEFHSWYKQCICLFHSYFSIHAEPHSNR